MTTPFPPDFHFDIAARSSAGTGHGLRLENQDNFLLINEQGHASFMLGETLQQRRIDDWPAGHARVAVLDGMGGHGHGREAAEAVVAGLLAMPPCASLAQLARLLDALHANLQLHFAGGDTPSKRPGTTLTLLELHPDQPAMLYHVGDSRLYRLTPTAVTPLTVDHVPATAFAMAGMLSEQEWWQQVHAEHRSQISQAFILGNAFVNPAVLGNALVELGEHNLPAFLHHLPDRRAVEIDEQSMYLLASDGFWACAEPYGWVASWPALLGHAATARETVDTLFEQIAQHPPLNLHPDNLTAIVVRRPPARALAADETALPTQQVGS
jgi:serine/threonine protein phosphatase PrpC